MATSLASWSAPSALSTNLAASGQFDSLAAGATSTAFAVFDNTSGRPLYGYFELALSSIAAAAGASVTLRRFSGLGATVPDNTASVGGGEPTSLPLTVSTSAKLVTGDIQLKPGLNYFALTNATTVALGTGNTFKIATYGELSTY